MSRSITLAVDVASSPSHVFRILTTTDGQRAFWTSDCDVSPSHATFRFAQAPVDLEVAVVTEADRLVRMNVESGFPHWDGSTWEWELAPLDDGKRTAVLFRHYDFDDGYGESDLGHTAQSWALINDRLSRYVATGTAEPFFPN